MDRFQYFQHLFLDLTLNILGPVTGIVFRVELETRWAAFDEGSPMMALKELGTICRVRVHSIIQTLA